MTGQHTWQRPRSSQRRKWLRWVYQDVLILVCPHGHRLEFRGRQASAVELLITQMHECILRAESGDPKLSPSGVFDRPVPIHCAACHATYQLPHEVQYGGDVDWQGVAAAVRRTESVGQRLKRLLAGRRLGG